MKILKKYFYTIASVLFLLAIVMPLFLIAKYNVPAVDDYKYGADAYKVLKSGGNVFDALKAAFFTTIDTYQIWQGTFTGIFLMALQPDVWGHGWYAMTTYTILPIFILGQLYFGDVLLHGICKAERRNSLVISCVVTGLSILWVPYPVESFFWFNGSSFYTLYYSLMLLLLGYLLYKMFCTSVIKWYSYGVVVLLAAFIGGGNYVTGLVLLELHALLVVFVLFWQKENKGKSLLFTSTGVLLFSFIVNVAAPGNSLRASGCNSMPAWKSIVESFVCACEYMGQWTSILVVFSMLFIFPFIWKIVEKVTFSFRYPLLVSVLSFCFFASHFTPTLYAQSYAGPGRLKDIIYYTYWILLAVNLTYWTGWLKEQMNMYLADVTVHDIVQKSFKKWLIPYFAVLLVGYVISMPFYGYKSTSSYSALQSLRNGEAKQYYAEYQERLVVLEDESLKEVKLNDFSVKPYVLFWDDVSEDPAHWKNVCVRQYYGKEKVEKGLSQE